ncbi:MAG: methyltransferase domain-containing protein [Betaproteobacteria bacterium]|nr:methyltransferase domain-containing protein [Betaproteobacteria bacterium]
MSILDRLVRRFVPLSVRVWWRRGGEVNLGDLRSTEPVSRVFGGDRGLPICRWYITRFLASQAGRVRGRVLEVAGNEYTRRYGGAQVTHSDVLMVVEGNPVATIVGDLQTGVGIPEGAFDTIILTQVLQCVFDLQGAMRTIHRALAPGGTVLITAPAIAPVSQYDVERWGEFWHLTPQSLTRLLAAEFGEANVQVGACGNHIAAHAYLAGLAAEELTDAELAPYDPDYPIVITAVATRAVAHSALRSSAPA